MLKLTGGLEQKVIEVLWCNKNPLKPKDVKEKLGSKLSYSTVKTVLERLFDKGFLDRKKEGNAYAYFPKESKEDYANKNLGDMFKGILDSFGSLAVTQFAETIKNDPDNISLLKKFLDDNATKK